MKKISTITIVIFLQHFYSFSQDNIFLNLDDKIIIPTLIKGAFWNPNNSSFQKIDCYSSDTLSIVHDTTFYWKSNNQEYALIVFYMVVEPIDKFSTLQTGVLLLLKNDKNLWEKYLTDMDVSKILRYEAPPKYRLLNLGGEDYGILTYDDYSGSMGYSYYLCEIYSINRGKVFSLNSLIDSSGAKEKKDSIETIKNIFTVGEDLCIQTKGHFPKYKKVNYTDFFKYNEEQNRYLRYKTINNLKK